MIPSWVWAIVSIVLFLIIFTIIFTLWKKKKSKKDEEKPEITLPSPTPTIEQDIQIKPQILYGQQFALVEPSQTILSPPPQRERKISSTTIDEQESQQISRKVFSLSPHQETDSIQDSCSSTTTRTITPFQGHTSWRGPTPPWTQT